jgi:hypothetical protein
MKLNSPSGLDLMRLDFLFFQNARTRLHNKYQGTETPTAHRKPFIPAESTFLTSGQKGPRTKIRKPIYSQTTKQQAINKTTSGPQIQEPSYSKTRLLINNKCQRRPTQPCQRRVRPIKPPHKPRNNFHLPCEKTFASHNLTLPVPTTKDITTISLNTSAPNGPKDGLRNLTGTGVSAHLHNILVHCHHLGNHEAFTTRTVLLDHRHRFNHIH